MHKRKPRLPQGGGVFVCLEKSASINDHKMLIHWASHLAATGRGDTNAAITWFQYSAFYVSKII